jgi:hypothetical protein
LASHPASGVFVLASSGEVSRVVDDQQGARIETLFRLQGSYQGVAIAADAQSVYVAAMSHLGCSVIRYSLSDKKKAERILGMREQCAGIATDGTSIYVTFPQKREIRFQRSWDSEPRSWSVSDAETLGPISFDGLGNRLIAADDLSGKAYAISTSDGTAHLLASNLGWVNSIAVCRQHILVASGNKILSLNRSDDRGENPPPSLQALKGGHIVGVAVDASDRVWFADYDNELVRGPLPLN